MSGWTDPLPNDFSIQGLRARFKSLEDWLKAPEFGSGVALGDGSPPTYDETTGTTIPAPASIVDSATFTALDGDLAQLQSEIDAILPITEVDISDDAITAPKIAANAVIAGKIAADAVTANEIAANTITANEIAADAVTANELAADSVTANKMASIAMEIGKYLQSAGYDGTDVATGDATTGWRVEADGKAEFSDVRVRGEFYAEAGGGAGRLEIVSKSTIWGDIPTVDFYTEHADETEPGRISAHSLPGAGVLWIESPVQTGGATARVSLTSSNPSNKSQVSLQAERVFGVFAVGMIMPFAGTIAPEDWLMCGGQAVSRVTYSSLFDVIGTAYGAGDGSTTFNVPDLRGRVPVGLDNMGGTDAGRLSVANTRGGTGGEEKHTLTTAEMPSHNHTQTAHNHPLNFNNSAVSFGANFIAGSSSTGALGNAQPSMGAVAPAIQNEGGSGSHNNMPPYLLVNYIIRTAP